MLHSKDVNILPTIHGMTKLFVPFCSAQDDESTDMNCLVFWAHCKNGKILTKHQVYIYNKGILPILGIFPWYKIIVPLECAADSEWNGAMNLVASCSVVELSVHKNCKKISLERPKSTSNYLNNCTCYDTVVCTILFSSRWRVYWYKLLSVLSTLQKWQNWHAPSSDIWNIQIIRMCSWFWVKWWN